MKFHFDLRRRGPLVGIAVLVAGLAGCQSGSGGFFGSGGGKAENTEKAEQIEQVDLMAYCPQVQLRDGTSFYNTYAKAGRDDVGDDRSRIIYQASISDVTRSCRYQDGQLQMTVAVAGKVVSGPKGKPGTISMPIRIAVLAGDQVVYSQLHKHGVDVAAMGASQYVLSDPAISIPAPTARNIRVMAGFDEGPYDTP